jgi:hypothetical protein
MFAPPVASRMNECNRFAGLRILCRAAGRRCGRRERNPNTRMPAYDNTHSAVRPAPTHCGSALIHEARISQGLEGGLPFCQLLVRNAG